MLHKFLEFIRDYSLSFSRGLPLEEEKTSVSSWWFQIVFRDVRKNRWRTNRSQFSINAYKFNIIWLVMWTYNWIFGDWKIWVKNAINSLKFKLSEFLGNLETNNMVLVNLQFVFTLGTQNFSSILHLFYT